MMNPESEPVGPMGSVALVLHAHLPYVRHPDHEHFLEEDWLYEAITETYVPLVGMMDDLARDGVPFALTMSLTPPLCEMLTDELLMRRYERRLVALIALAREIAVEKRGTPYEAGAEDALRRFEHVREIWAVRHGRDLVSAFRRHQESGRLVIVTCGATHGLLALAATHEGRRAQIEVARTNYRKHFGCYPDGIWLPECAYQTGIDTILHESGFRFFFTETHGVTYADPRPRFAHYRPILTEAGVMAFARDPACSKQVWSAETGYPGDPLYREFYRDAGWEAPEHALRELIGGGPRRNVGLKLHRITGRVPLDQKEPYVPAWARARAADHARHFLGARVAQAHALRAAMLAEPLVVAPYDAELFGHWWYEGPDFIEAIFRNAHAFPEIALTTPRAWEKRHPVAQIARPAPSSWGDRGYWDVWLNGDNGWIYRHLHRAEERMVELATELTAPSELDERALTQLGRELLLAQSSDWAFIMTTGTTVPYAVRRTKDHINRFTGLYEQIVGGRLDPKSVHEIRWRDPIFSEIDYREWL